MAFVYGRLFLEIVASDLLQNGLVTLTALWSHFIDCKDRDIEMY